jgi:diguanylate cyclase (GGDEF)-like protein
MTGAEFWFTDIIYIHDFHHSGEGEIMKASPLWDELSEDGDGTGEREVPDPVDILIVEDDTSFLTALIYVLENAGYIVHDVTTAEGAVEFLETFRQPVIVLVDIGLPDHSGIELMRRLKKLPQFKQIIAMSGGKEKQQSEEARKRNKAKEDQAIDAGATKFLWKETFVGAPEELLRHLKPMARTIRDYGRSLIDRLTGLPNDTYFELVLRRSLAQARRRGDLIALLFIDVDGLKATNDRYGIPNGSRIITHVGEYIQKHLRPWDIAGRFRTGDEFMVLLPRTDETYAAMLSLTIDLDIQSHKARLDTGEEIDVSASIGYATRKPDEIESDLKKAAERIMKDADAMMRKAKAERKAQGIVVRR